MTGDEMERAIEFLLEQQAQTARQLELYAETQSEFIRIATETIAALGTAQQRADERLNSLIGAVERHITETHGAQG